MSRARTQSDTVIAPWCLAVTGDVLSIGSQADQDGAGKPYRAYFAHARSYTTSEVAPGRGTDLVLDVRAMPTVAACAYDAIFCSGVLEHVDDCHAAVSECFRILRPGGLFLVGVPFQQRLHRAPQDFWRFTEQGICYLLNVHAFRVEAVAPIGDDPKFPWTYWVRARRPEIA
jgi:SAM-dependent methyltransferase